jgi:hypothetical protein
VYNINLTAGLQEGDVGTNQVIDPIGGYSWSFAFHKNQAVMLSCGFHNLGVDFWRCPLPSDPGNQLNQASFGQGYLSWASGQPVGFPRGTRPSFGALHGFQGFGHVGSDVAPTTHDICVVYNGGTAAYQGALTTYAISSMTLSAGQITIVMAVSTFVEQVGNYVYVTGNGNSTFNGFFRVIAYTDAQHFTVAAPSASGVSSGSPVINTGDQVLCMFVQLAGANPSVNASGIPLGTPRPEWDPSGTDWRDLSYFIRRCTTAGSYPVPALPGPANSDTVAPEILTCTAARVDFNTITVSWTTDKDTIGVACAGSDTNYNHPFNAKPYLYGGVNPMLYSSWSPIETSYGTTHSATIPWVPKSLPTHFSVVVKDRAGNSSYAQDQTIGASPDGSFITAPGSKLVTQYGEWSFGAQTTPPASSYGGGPLYYILLNGKPASGPTYAMADKLMVDFGGNLYAASFDLNWYGWGGYEWQGNNSGSLSGPNPPSGGSNLMPGLPSGFNPPYVASADGSTSSTGPLTTQDGVWTIDGSSHLILNNIALGGAQNGFTSANMLEVNAHGQLFFRDLSNNWWIWEYNTANQIVGTPPSGAVPVGITFSNMAGGGPYPVVSHTAPSGTHIADISVTMSDGSAFSGTYTVTLDNSGLLFASTSGNSLVTAVGWNNAQAGRIVQVTAVQNGCGCSNFIDTQVT